MATPTIEFKKLEPVHVAASDMQFAQHDPALCGMPGLFRDIHAKSRDAGATGLKLSYVCGDMMIKATGIPLGGEDLAVLQAIVSLARVHGDMLPLDGQLAAHEHQLLAALEALDDADGEYVAEHDDAYLAPRTCGASAVAAATKEGVVAEPTDLGTAVRHAAFSTASLLEIIGWHVTGDTRKIVDESIQRLATCVLIVHPVATPTAWQRYHLLSAVQTDTSSKKWRRTHIALNPRLTQIMMGARDKGRHTRILLAETRRLAHDYAARVLHQRLCSWIDIGKEEDVSYRKLMSYVWPDDAMQRGAEFDRRQVDRAFAKLSSVQLQQQRLKIIQATVNKFELLLPGWAVTLASEKPFCPDMKATPAERATAYDEHQRRQARSAKQAADDPFDTVVWIRRGPVRRAGSGAAVDEPAVDEPSAGGEPAGGELRAVA